MILSLGLFKKKQKKLSNHNLLADVISEVYFFFQCLSKEDIVKQVKSEFKKAWKKQQNKRIQISNPNQ